LLDTEGPKAKYYVEVAEQHDVHLTYGENIYEKDCTLPACRSELDHHSVINALVVHTASLDKSSVITVESRHFLDLLRDSFRTRATRSNEAPRSHRKVNLIPH